MPIELTDEAVDELKEKLVEAAKESFKSWLEMLKQDGDDEIDRGKEFGKASQNLLSDMVSGNISKEEFDDGIDDLGKALQSHLISEAYAKSRKHLQFFINTLKMLADIATKIVL